MNTTDPTPSGGLQPPPLNPPAPAPEPLAGPFSILEALLREPNRVWHSLRGDDAGRVIAVLIFATAVCAALYGVVIGSFSKGTQLWAAPVKVTLGLFFSVIICLPSLYIFSCLSGSQARLAEVCGMIAGLLALMTVLLIGFAPVAWVFSQSTESLAAMGALHLVFWFIATYFGVRFLSTGFAHLSGKPGGLRVWVIIFLLVMAQMTTTLRPLVGTSDAFLQKEKKFFVKHWIEQLEKSSSTKLTRQ